MTSVISTIFILQEHILLTFYFSCKLVNFYKADKTINNVPLKSLVFQTGQTNWDGGSNFFITFYIFHKNCIKIFLK